MTIKVILMDHGHERVPTHRCSAHPAGFPPPPPPRCFSPLIFSPALPHRKKQAPTARFCANYILLPHKSLVPASSSRYGMGWGCFFGFFFNAGEAEDTAPCVAVLHPASGCHIPHQGAASRIGVPHPTPEHPPGTEELLGQAAPRRAAAEGHKFPWWPLDYVFFLAGAVFGSQ